MKRRLFKDGVIYGLGTLGLNVTGFVLLPFFTRILSPADLGTYDYLNSIFIFVQLFVALEITQGFALYYADAVLRRNKEAYASTALLFVSLGYSVFLVTSYVLRYQISALVFGNHDEGQLVALGSFLIAFKGILLVLQNQLRWELRAVDYTISNLLSIVLSGFLALGILVGVSSTLEGFLCGHLAGNMIAVTFALYKIRHSLKLAFEPAKLREMLGFSLPLVISSLAIIIGSQADRVLIKQMISLSDLGVYGVASRVAVVLDLSVSAFRMSIAPLIYQNHRNPETPKAVADIFRYFGLAALFALAFLFLFSGEIMSFIATKEYAAGAAIIPLLAIKSLLASLLNFAPGLALTKRTRTIALISVMGAAMSVLLHIRLISMFGLYGAAVAGIGSAAFVFLGNLGFSQRHFYIPFEWARVGMGILLISLLVVFPGRELSIFVKSLLFFGVCLSLSLLLINREEAMKFWTKSVFWRRSL